MFRKTSLGSVGLVVGGILTVVGFVAYFTDNATLNLVGFFYGIPVLLGGFALKAAELQPAPISPPSSAQMMQLRQEQATATQTQILKDVTRYRYGQSSHLDTALDYLGLSPTDDECPTLTHLNETEIEGHYVLNLYFYSPLIKIETWQAKLDKMERFFGPGVRVKTRISDIEAEEVEVQLIADPAAAPAES